MDEAPSVTDMRRSQWVSDRPLGLLMPTSSTTRCTIRVVRTLERSTRFSREPDAEGSDIIEPAPGTVGHDLPFVLWNIDSAGKFHFADLTMTIRAACNGTFVYNGRTLSPIACHCLTLAISNGGGKPGVANFIANIDSGRYVSKTVAHKFRQAASSMKSPLFAASGSALPPIPAHFCVTGPAKVGKQESRRRNEFLSRRRCFDPGHGSSNMHVISNAAMAMAKRNRRFIPRCTMCPDFHPQSTSKTNSQTPLGTHRGLSVKLLKGHLIARIRDEPKKYERFAFMINLYDGIFSCQTPRMLASLAACSSVDFPVAPGTKTQVILAVGAKLSTAFLAAVMASRLECTDVMACIFSDDVIRGIIAADRPSKKRCIFDDSVIWDILFGTGFGAFEKTSVVGGVCRTNFFNYVAPDVARGIPGKEAAKTDLSRQVGLSPLELSRVVTERVEPHVYGNVSDRMYYDETIVQIGCALIKGLLEIEVCFTGSASNAETPTYGWTEGRNVVTTSGRVTVIVQVDHGELLTWPTLRSLLHRARREVEDIPGKALIRLKINANLRRTYCGCNGHMMPHHYSTIFSKCFADATKIKLDPVQRNPLTGSTLATVCMMRDAYPSKVTIAALDEEFHASRLHPTTEDHPGVKQCAAAILSEEAGPHMARDLFFEAPSMMKRRFYAHRFAKLVAVISSRGTVPGSYGTFGKISATSLQNVGDDRESEGSGGSSSSFTARVAMASSRKKSQRSDDSIPEPAPKRRKSLMHEGTINAGMLRFFEPASEGGAP